MRTYQVVDASELATAYAAATYAARLDGDDVRLRVGEPAAELEARWPAERYVFITAWNPASRPLSDRDNEAADARLVKQLDDDGIARLPAFAQSPDGRWHEPGWLLADVEPAEAIRLAREFGQAGVLCWDRGAPVRLHMAVARPSSSGPAAAPPHTEWDDARHQAYEAAY